MASSQRSSASQAANRTLSGGLVPPWRGRRSSPTRRSIGSRPSPTTRADLRSGNSGAAAQSGGKHVHAPRWSIKRRPAYREAARRPTPPRQGAFRAEVVPSPLDGRFTGKWRRRLGTTRSPLACTVSLWRSKGFTRVGEVRGGAGGVIDRSVGRTGRTSGPRGPIPARMVP